MMNADARSSRLEREILSEMRRAVLFGQFLDSLTQPVTQRIPEVPPQKLGKGHKLRERLLERDGDDCWLCGDPLGDDATIEHRIPKSAGGTGNPNNLVLCHELCNRALAHRSIEQKDALREATRAAKRSEAA